jgi:hypothetical protein
VITAAISLTRGYIEKGRVGVGLKKGEPVFRVEVAVGQYEV